MGSGKLQLLMAHLHKIFWADRRRTITKTLQLDMENPEEGPEVVFEHLVTVRSSREGLCPETFECLPAGLVPVRALLNFKLVLQSSKL